MKFSRKRLLGAMLLAGLAATSADACTRFLYENAKGGLFVGRTLDWMEDTKTDLWAFPKGLARTGGAGSNPIKWTSKYSSVTASMYGIATIDGLNNAGLVGNMLYLAEAKYGSDDPARKDKPTLSVGAWMQYALDNYATVTEAVKGLSAEPFRIIAPTLPSGDAAVAHLALSDASGDSAIFEYVEGKLIVHHDRNARTMTNSPTYDQQLAINTYWEEVGGTAMLPGTYRASDRFVRATYNLKSTPKFDSERESIAAVVSMARNISVPLGIKDPKLPNIASTIWRTVSDVGARRYFFDSTYSPEIFWVDLDKLKFPTDGKALQLSLEGNPQLAGEVSAKFVPTTPFKWLH